MTPLSRKRHIVPLLLALLLLATVVLYWRGLYGPFLLDDPYALRNLDSWRAGKQSLWMVLFGNESFLMHRALALASLAINIAIGGDSSFSLKVGNLLHHLLSGLFVWLLVRQMFLRDAKQASAASTLALLVTALWLLHPLHVSTVLYVVQRMAQVAALCCFIGMWLYMTTRSRMLAGTWSQTQGLWIIWIGIPLLTLLGIQGKQNAAILPMLCLVLELAYFGGVRAMPRPLRGFYLLGVVVPLVALAIGLATGNRIIYGNYAAYDFNMGERLLSEARALWVYVGNTFTPNPPNMGVFSDDFIVSRGLFSPATTALSILALLTVSAIALRLRARMPSLFAGWFLFLVGHAVESSFLPLELYYEHRNYLPSVGLLVIAVTLVRTALRALQQKGVETRRIAVALAAGSLLLVTFQTGGRVHVWQRLDTILRTGVEAHPRSIYANYALLNSLVLVGRYDEIAQHLQIMSQVPDTKTQGAAVIYKMNVQCALYRTASPDDLHTYLSLLPRKHIELSTTQAFEAFITIAERKQGACGPVSFRMLGDTLRQYADDAVDQPVDSYTMFTTRQHAARMYMAAGDARELAIEQARLSWQPISPANYSAVLIRALLVDGRVNEAEQVLAQAEAKTSAHNLPDQEGLQLMRELIGNAKAATATTPVPAQVINSPP